MKKVLFYYCVLNSEHTLFLGTAHLYLKTFIDLVNPALARGLHWQLPIQFEVSDQELIQICNDNDIDFLCTSHYIWNHNKFLQQLARIKPYLNPKIKILSGGPSINVNVDSEFFIKYPFIDYAMYGPGEQAFHDILQSLVLNKPLTKEFTSNCAWQDSGSRMLAPFKYVKMMSTSPFIHNAAHFKSMVTAVRQGRPYLVVVVPYELTRGCPYACTFCDWNSGLSNKVSRRKDTFRDEIDLFHEAQAETIYLSDANVGQYDEDVEMVEYFSKKNLEQGANFKLMGNLSKLKKENNLKIFHLMAKGKMLNQGFTISCQDVQPQILLNIERPDISWAEHSAMIDDLYHHHPNIPSQIQLIQGLPGQTVDLWRNTLQQVSQKSSTLMIFVNELLAASPAAYDSDYQKKWQYVYSSSERYMGPELSSQGQFYRGNFSQSCSSFSKNDFVKMTILSHIYSMLCLVKYKLRKYGHLWQIENIVNDFLQSSYYILVEENLKNNWTNDKFYYTINIDGSKKVLSACTSYHAPVEWLKTKNIQKLIAKHINNPALKQAMMDYDWQSVTYTGSIDY